MGENIRWGQLIFSLVELIFFVPALISLIQGDASLWDYSILLGSLFDLAFRVLDWLVLKKRRKKKENEQASP